jgi:hypothetical protein
MEILEEKVRFRWKIWWINRRKLCSYSKNKGAKKACRTAQKFAMLEYGK